MKILNLMLRFFIAFLFSTVLIVIVFRFIDPATTPFIMYNSNESILNVFRCDVKYKPISINNISYYAPLAVIASEDQRFFEHFGFDLIQLEKAMKENEYRKIKRGASTITMQVAKNLFLFPSKTFLRKILEAYYTILIELLWSKKRILEVYLNVAEMGKGIYGVYYASKIYFKKSPINLTKAEAATLAALLPNPKKRNPQKPSSYLIFRKNQIIRQMDLIGGINFIKNNL